MSQYSLTAGLCAPEYIFPGAESCGLLLKQLYLFSVLQGGLPILFAYIVAISISVSFLMSVFSRLVTSARCRINGSQHVDTCLDGIPADDKSVFGMLDALRRDIDDKIDLVAQDQVHEVRRLLLDLIGTGLRLHAVLRSAPGPCLWWHRCGSPSF